MVKLRANSTRGAGGMVSVGPFHKLNATSHDLLTAAILKFKQDDCRFDDKCHYQLTYPDGRIVDELPDGSGPFNIEGYKTFKGQNYDRLRLYLCRIGG